MKEILADIERFSLKVHLKEKSLAQLYNLIVCVEDKIKPHAEELLQKIVYKDVLSEEPEIAHRVLRISELLGLHVPTDFILPMIMKHLNDQESKQVPRFVSSCLQALSAVIVHSSVKYGT